ncbi:MAG: hypothetical protein PHU21_01990 [Elusimicrobia bacterium]|nr:hypothetical protein [Elusimicrobiota bacterium]
MRGRGGFVLVEASMTYLVLGLAVVALVPVFLLSVRANKATERVATATHLAQELLEEVRLRRWDELTPVPPEAVPSGSPVLGPDSGETAGDKRAFDDADDFNGWQEAAPLDPVMRPVASFETYRRSVSVGYLTEAGAPSAGPTDRKQVTVCVSGGKMRPVCLDALLANR